MDLLKKIQNRFVTKKELFKIPVRNKFIKEISIIYQTYYRQVISHNFTVKQGEVFLFSELNKCIVKHEFHDQPIKKIDDLEQFLTKTVLKLGYFGKFGDITPYKTAFIWKKQKSNKFNVL